MNLLHEDESWNLLREKVFGEESCPPELEDIGRTIASKCKGLPLSIVVIGGLLAKSEMTPEYWEHVAANLSETVNLEDNERCLKILSMSYTQLPVHLKPCFLYMGVFPEDKGFRVSSLIKLWVAEGFLRPVSCKWLEEVAEDYLKDLIDRNLVLVHSRGSTGKIMLCGIHDLLRDLGLRQAEKEKFLCVIGERNLISIRDINTKRRLAVHLSTSNKNHIHKALHALQSPSLTRSLIWSSQGYLPSLKVRLLRVFRDEIIRYEYSPEAILQLVNARYLSFMATNGLEFPSLVHLLWNLQTLRVRGSWLRTTAPPEIWSMPQLRHVEFNLLYLPEPPCRLMEEGGRFTLRDLQTLLKIGDFKCDEEVVERIPNIKKLKVSYRDFSSGFEGYCLNNLGRLNKLEALACDFLSGPRPPNRSDLLHNISFSHSLKKLSLRGSGFHWEDMITTQIGLLPYLEVLKLKTSSFRGPEWILGEELFCRLKFLLIEGCHDLEYWTAESTHFPCLEQLVLEYLYKLEGDTFRYRRYTNSSVNPAELL